MNVNYFYQWKCNFQMTPQLMSVCWWVDRSFCWSVCQSKLPIIQYAPIGALFFLDNLLFNIFCLDWRIIDHIFYINIFICGPLLYLFNRPLSLLLDPSNHIIIFSPSFLQDPTPSMGPHLPAILALTSI